MNLYEKKLEARKARYENRADKARQDSDAQFKRSDSLTSGIPFGQPILVGHHSEARHRRTLERSDAAMRKGIEAGEKAGYYAGKAASVGLGGISSDDPEAVVKLKERIATLQNKQDRMKAANKALKKGDDTALFGLGFTEQSLALFKEPDFAGRAGYASYQLTNNNANIRRLKQRLATLETAQNAEHKETEHAGFSVVENVEENRIQVIFPGKPSADVRAVLKSHGFRWSRYNSAWQRHLNNAGRYAAECVVKQLEGLA